MRDIYMEPVFFDQGPGCQAQQYSDSLSRRAHAWQGSGILELATRDLRNGKLQEKRSADLGIQDESARVSETPFRRDLG